MQAEADGGACPALNNGAQDYTYGTGGGTTTIGSGRRVAEDHWATARTNG
ncbi:MULTISPECIES: hypothetical protein [unclassified Streptomyces]